MRQRLIKAIFCIALSVSVFFCFSSLSLADEVDTVSDEVVTFFSVEGVSEEYDFSLLADLDEDDYTGSALFQVLSQKTHLTFLHTGLNPWTEKYHLVSVQSVPVYLTIGFQVERGHTYSGAVITKGTTKLTSQITSTIESFTLEDVSFVSPDDIDVSMYPVLIYPSDIEASYTFNINFNNFQATYDGYVYINVVMHYNLQLSNSEALHAGYYPASGVVANTHASDWAGTLKDYATDAIIDSDGSLIKNQTIQQQQIADQQAQQSAQQHDNLVNGYDNAANDNMLADKNSVLQGFEQQQDQAISGGQQYVADYSSSFSTAPLQAMAPAFMMISTWFNDLWSGMGNFSTVLVVGLMLCVAGYILKLKH